VAFRLLYRIHRAALGPRLNSVFDVSTLFPIGPGLHNPHHLINIYRPTA